MECIILYIFPYSIESKIKHFKTSLRLSLLQEQSSIRTNVFLMIYLLKHFIQITNYIILGSPKTVVNRLKAAEASPGWVGCL